MFFPLGRGEHQQHDHGRREASGEAPALHGPGALRHDRDRDDRKVGRADVQRGRLPAPPHHLDAEGRDGHVLGQAHRQGEHHPAHRPQEGGQG